MNLKDIAQGAVEKLRGYILEAMRDRGKVATGRTARSMGVLATGGESFGQASLEAEKQWRYVGNGRGPGAMPPIGPIQQWINARGLNLSAWAVAVKIGRLGSRDFRLGRRNLFLQEIEAWEAKDVPLAEQAAAEYFAGKALNEIDKAIN